MPEEYFDAWELRRRFRELDILGQLGRGEVTSVVDDEHLAPRVPSSRQEP